jgi:hypothetical protein
VDPRNEAGLNSAQPSAVILAKSGLKAANDYIRDRTFSIQALTSVDPDLRPINPNRYRPISAEPTRDAVPIPAFTTPQT